MFRQCFSFSAAYIKGDECFFSCNSFNGLMHLNMKNNKIEYICNFPDEEKSAMYLHRKCIAHKNFLFFLPENSKGIHVYDIQKKTIRLIKIKEDGDHTKLMADACAINNLIYMFPSNFKQKIRIINMDTFEVCENNNIEMKCNELDTEVNKGVVFTRVISVDGVIYATIYNTSMLVRYVSGTDEVSVINTGIMKLFSVFNSNEGFWLYTIDNKLYKWENGKITDKKYQVQIDEITEGGARYFVHLVETECGILALPNLLQKIYIMHANEEIAYDALEYPDEFDMLQGISVKFWGYQVVGKMVYVFPQGSDYLLVIDAEKRAIKALKWEIPYENEEYSFVLDTFKTNDKFIENKKMKLGDFLFVIKKSK